MIDLLNSTINIMCKLMTTKNPVKESTLSANSLNHFLALFYKDQTSYKIKVLK